MEIFIVVNIRPFIDGNNTIFMIEKLFNQTKVVFKLPPSIKHHKSKIQPAGFQENSRRGKITLI